MMDTLETLRLADIGKPIHLDTRAGGRGADVPHAVVVGTLIGVTHYRHQRRDELRTRIEVRTFGDQVTVLEFVDGDLTRPAPDDDEPGTPTIW